MTTVASVVKKFKAYWALASLPGCGYKKKIDPRLNWRIVWIKVHQGLITPSVTFWVTMRLMKDSTVERKWNLLECRLTSHNSSGRTSMERAEIRSLEKAHSNSSLLKKSVPNYLLAGAEAWLKAKQKLLVCSDCLQTLCNKILGKGCHNLCPGCFHYFCPFQVISEKIVGSSFFVEGYRHICSCL